MPTRPQSPAAATPSRWPVVTALGLVMIFTWGSTYYLMAVLATPIAADTGWGLGAMTGALSAGLLVAGLASPLVGRRIAAFGGRPVLLTGVALIAGGLVLLSLAQTLWMFWAAWGVLGLGMAAGLYDPAFATLGRLYGRDARRTITQLTLLGGLASTVCWPLSAWMLSQWGWRGVALGYAALHVTVILPLVWFAIPALPARGTPGQPRASEVAALNRVEARAFGAFAAMQVLHGLIMVNVSVWLFSFLQAQGMDLAAAVAIGAMMGPAQVAARMLELAHGERHHPLWTLSAAVLVVASGLILLALDLGIAGVAIILFGAGNGLYSIVRGALPLVLFGEARYAGILGRLARPWLIAQAVAPSLGAFAIARWGEGATLVMLAALALANLLVLAWLWRVTARLR